jgi:hypothetical protein
LEGLANTRSFIRKENTKLYRPELKAFQIINTRTPCCTDTPNDNREAEMENRTIITGEIARQRGRISAGQTEGELRN